jgi:hypothetical protein
MHQTNIRERNQQVRQMRRIYQKAKAVVVWIGPDTEDKLASAAATALVTISDFICNKLNLSITGLSTRRNLYQEVLYRNREKLPLPNECPFSSDAVWKPLVWFYSHLYFTRLWVIQEINASTNRIVHCGREEIDWDRVDLVAGYIIMDTAFSKQFGFSETRCWWASMVTTERLRNPRNWITMLYLASNFSCLDDRDMIYGLRGLMHLTESSPQANLLDPDYSKSTTEVFRDSVEAAFHDFQNTDALLYLVGDESPSWIPLWNRPMLFRNPFRFGKSLPWKPAGETYPKWHIDKKANVLTLSGFIIDTVSTVTIYNESIFSNSLFASDEGRAQIKSTLLEILDALRKSQNTSSPEEQPPNNDLPLSTPLLTSAATALSYGLDAEASPASPTDLLKNFIAFLHLILPSDAFDLYIPPDLHPANTTPKADPHAFGKPTWDFTYPDSGFFVTEHGLVGCCVCLPQPGDVIAAMEGGTYVFVLRPFARAETASGNESLHKTLDESGDESGKAEKVEDSGRLLEAGKKQDEAWLLRGYAYVHGVMNGERWDAVDEAGQEVQLRDFKIH